MDLGIKYRGKIATTEDVAFINNLIQANPNDSRRALSARLCKAWNWVQPNGALRDMVCRGFMLELHRAGYIQLPAKKCAPNNPLVNRVTPKETPIDQSPLCSSLKQILPWVNIKFLASHILSRLARILPQDWQSMYSHPVYYLETFVDTERFRGTCYRAANWIYLGKTTGRGKNDHTKKPNRSLKAVYGYPLIKDFRKKLGVST